MDENYVLIQAKESGERIDALLARKLENFSRSAAQKLIDEGFVTLNGNAIKKNYKCVVGDTFAILLPDLAEVELVAQDIPLDIAYEDEDIIVINKSRG
ncbi:MAG: RNA pseudouridine synthase, partial [Oscillospiraceae bacterium]|nr:RNA pseudouridine synthase [Oscillospiraceae bacterium]